MISISKKKKKIIPRSEVSKDKESFIEEWTENEEEKMALRIERSNLMKLLSLTNLVNLSRWIDDYEYISMIITSGGRGGSFRG